MIYTWHKVWSCSANQWMFNLLWLVWRQATSWALKIPLLSRTCHAISEQGGEFEDICTCRCCSVHYVTTWVTWLLNTIQYRIRMVEIQSAIAIRRLRVKCCVNVRSPGNSADFPFCTCSCMRVCMRAYTFVRSCECMHVHLSAAVHGCKH